ncbi:1-phosphatidylinositol 4,5-bisphosphate phosphodiesterase beta-4-like isoform X2 [Dysidea avara]|uniref:1-phosphatidylinositol 4,5-bisphosphate phosphodiesterase beta-4-like isoform X2 n=1 Tax=Dysidea avara TaxID=196820 RepID=UPI00331E088C
MASETGFKNKRRALKPVVPEILTAGTTLWRWARDGGEQVAAVPLVFKVDPDGFYLYARSDDSKETLFWDLCLISDVRIAEHSSCGSAHETMSRKDSSSIRNRLSILETIVKESVVKRDHSNDDDDDDDDDGNDSFLDLVYRRDGITDLEFITLIAQNSEVAGDWMDAVNSLTHNLYRMNNSMSDMVKKMRVKLSLHSNELGQLQLKMIDTVLLGNSESIMESIKFSLEIYEVPIQDIGDDSFIEVDKLTDEIVEDIISRVAHCTDHVQTVFLEQGCKIPNMDDERLLTFLNKVQRDPRDNEVIKEYYEKSKATSIIHTLEPKGKEIGKLTPVGMWRFLASEESNLVDKTQLGLVMDMSQPLSHYYINSSHNTYCCGTQISGQSSVEIYRQCLLQGCRCVELDCWIQNDDIIVTHGFMSGVWVCTTVSFEKVLQAIRDFAFVTTDYPLILSIENHVDKPHLLQRMAVLYCLTFGDRLLREPLKGYPLEPGAPLPSPELLKGKILLKDKIKLKKLREVEGSSPPEGVTPLSNPTTPNKKYMSFSQSDTALLTTKTALSSSDEEDSIFTPHINGDVSDDRDEEEMDLDTVEISDNNSSLELSNTEKKEKSTKISLSSIDENVENATLPAADEEKWIVPDYTLKRRSHVKRNAIRSISYSRVADMSHVSSIVKLQEHDTEEIALGPGCSEEVIRNYQMRHVSEGMALVGGPLVEMLNYCTAAKFEGFEAAETSMDEDKALQVLSAKPVEFAKYNARQFTRIYPAGKRINSSNYLPDWYWSAGCQIVALNYQTPDLPMQLNFAKFEQNLKCGYILKPSILQHAKVIPFNMFDQRYGDTVPSKITIKILSGLFLSERLNMVDIEMFGLPVDTVRKGVMKTRYQVGPHPEWNNHDETFVFKKVILPEMCLLRISVADDKGDLIGQRVLPLSMIRSGYRFVTLRDKHSQPLLLTSLFVFIKIEDFVPDHWTDFVTDMQRPRSLSASCGKAVDINTEDMELPKTRIARISLTTLEIDNDMLNKVKTRNIPAIKPSDVVVTNSKRMVKFNKKMDKEYGAIGRALKPRPSSSGIDLKMLRAKSLEPQSKKLPEGDVLHSDRGDEEFRLQFKISEERYNETAAVLLSLHEEQVKTLLKMHEKELVTYQKLITQAYCDQIAGKNKQNGKKMEASMKHLRVEIAKKCAEKIQVMKELHTKELQLLTSSQNKVQELLQTEKEQELKQLTPAHQQ